MYIVWDGTMNQPSAAKSFEMERKNSKHNKQQQLQHEEGKERVENNDK